MKILQYSWQSAGATGNTIGYVLVEDDFGYTKCYAGICKEYPAIGPDDNPEYLDASWIAKWGGTVPQEIAEVIFNVKLDSKRYG